MVRPTHVLLAAVLGILVVACGGRTASPPSAVPSTAVETPSPAPSAPAANPNVTFACLGLGEIDCLRALEAVATAIPPDADAVYAEVGPFGCSTGEQCPTTLLARPAGSVTVELAAGDPVAFQVSVGADGSLEVVPGEAFTVAVAPSSAPGQLTGPMPFTLGHCGLWSGVDVDGSWWDPVGFVDSSHGDSINAAEGTFVPADRNHATFTSDGGFSVELLRRLGDKHLPLCM